MVRCSVHLFFQVLNHSRNIPPVTDMGKDMADLDPAIRQMLFAGLAPGGGIDRNQIQADGLPGRQTGGAELALEQHEIIGTGDGGQPGKNRGEILGLIIKIRRDLGLGHADLCGRLDNAVHPEGGASIGCLRPGEGMVEEENEGGGQADAP